MIQSQVVWFESCDFQIHFCLHFLCFWAECLTSEKQQRKSSHVNVWAAPLGLGGFGRLHWERGCSLLPFAVPQSTAVSFQEDDILICKTLFRVVILAENTHQPFLSTWFCLGKKSKHKYIRWSETRKHLVVFLHLPGLVTPGSPPATSDLRHDWNPGLPRFHFTSSQITHCLPLQMFNR